MSIGSLLPTPKVNPIDSPRAPKIVEKTVWCRDPKTGKQEEHTMPNARDLQRHQGWEIISEKRVTETPTPAEQEDAQKAFLNGPTSPVVAVVATDPQAEAVADAAAAKQSKG